MQRFKATDRIIAPGTVLIWEGQSSPWLYTVLRGQGLRVKQMEDGQRQVLNFIFPGDFIGLQAAIMGEMKHTVEATTEMTLCVFPRADLWSLFRDQPARAYDLTYITAAEEHFLGDALATIGQRTAIERMAWALWRLWRRAEAVGLLRDGAAPLPWRQRDLADAVALSLVHTNKTLARLRQAGLADWHDGWLRLPGRAQLAELAQVEDRPADPRPLF